MAMPTKEVRAELGVVDTMSGLVVVDPFKIKVLTKSDGTPINPRNHLQIDDLLVYIEKNGVDKLPPIDIQVQKDANGKEELVLIQGHRRLEAVKTRINCKQKIKGIRAYIIPTEKGSPQLNLGDVLVRNLAQNQGMPLEKYEIADGIKLLLSYGWKQAEIARQIGKSTERVNQLLKDGEVSEEVRQAERDKLITAHQAKLITSKTANISDPTVQKELQDAELAKAIKEKEERNVKQGIGTQGSRKGRPKLATPSAPKSTNGTTPSNAPSNGTPSNAMPSNGNASGIKTGASERVEKGKAEGLHSTINRLFFTEHYSVQDLLKIVLLIDRNTNKGMYSTPLEQCYNAIVRIDKDLPAINVMARQPVKSLKDGTLILDTVQPVINVTTNGVTSTVEKTDNGLVFTPVKDTVTVENTDTVTEQDATVSENTDTVSEAQYVTFVLLADDKAKVKTGKKGKAPSYTNVKYIGSKKQFTALDSHANKVIFPLEERYSAKKTEYRINAESIVTAQV